MTLRGIHNHSRWKMSPTWQMLPVKYALAEQLPVDRPAHLMWWRFLKYMPRPACLTKSPRLLSVYFSMSHVPLVTALWREQSCGCRHTVLGLSGAGARQRANANLLFHLSAEGKHPFPEMLNKTGSRSLLTALQGLGGRGGASGACLPTAAAPSWAISLGLFNLRGK